MPDTLAPSHLSRTISRAGAAAAKTESSKRVKYSALTSDFHFVPVAVETLGVLGREAAKFIRQLGRRLVEVSNDRRQTSFLRQRISVAVQRGNAAAVLATFSEYCGDGPEEVG